MSDEGQRLLHDLEVHREELTIQNEALRRAQVDLETSRDRYAELYDLGPAGYVDLDQKGKILSINATAASLLGVLRLNAVGLPFVPFVEPLEIHKFFDFLRRCIRGDGRVDAQITLRPHGDFKRRRMPTHFAGAAVRQGEGKILRLAFIDISGQEEEEEEQAIRTKRAAQVNDFSVIALSHADFSEIAAAAAMLAAQVLGAGFAEILELHPEGGRLRTVATAGQKGKAASDDIPADSSPYGKVLRTRQPVVIENLPADVVSRAHHLVQARIAGGLAVLVPAEPAQPYGVLGVYSRIRRPYDNSEIDFLQSIANTLGVAAANRRMEAALRESEARFRTLVENSTVGILIVQEGKVVYMNPKQETIFGKIPVPFDVEELGPFVHPEDLDRLLRLRRTNDFSWASHGEEISLRLRPRTREAGTAEFVWTDCRANPIRFGDRDALLVNAVDVTRAKELEQIAAQSDKMASLGQLTAGMAHEIRNPLSGINIYLSSLEKLLGELKELDDEKQEMARHIVASLTKNSERVESVIRKVMDLSRPKAPKFAPSDLNRCIESAVELSTINLRRAGVQIRKVLAEGLASVNADPQLIEQVLLNMLTNATQAVARKSGRREIEVSSAMENGRVVVRVGDSGPGVPESIRGKIFSPFFTTKQEGIGIGLAFSHRVITEHRGFLTVGPSPLGGAEFRIELPVPADPASKRSAKS